MIKFYYFVSNAKDMSRPAFRVRGMRGPFPVCQVYSNRNSRELSAWAKEHKLPKAAIHRHAGLMPHLDLWGNLFKLGGEEVSREEFVADVACWDRWPTR